MLPPFLCPLRLWSLRCSESTALQPRRRRKHGLRTPRRASPSRWHDVFLPFDRSHSIGYASAIFSESGPPTSKPQLSPNCGLKPGSPQGPPGHPWGHPGTRQQAVGAPTNQHIGDYYKCFLLACRKTQGLFVAVRLSSLANRKQKGSA